MSIDEKSIKEQAPIGATYYLIKSNHAWYFKNPKSWKIYHRHEWMPYCKTGFGFNLSDMFKL